jgi:hypothetical protein
VQGVEGADQVVAERRELGGVAHLEMDTVRDACLGGSRTGPLDRPGVVVESVERGGGEALRHEDRGDPVSAADVGDAGARGEALGHALQGGDPVVEQVGVVGGAEDLRDSVDHVVVLLAVADAVSGPHDRLQAV